MFCPHETDKKDVVGHTRGELHQNSVRVYDLTTVTSTIIEDKRIFYYRDLLNYTTKATERRLLRINWDKNDKIAIEFSVTSFL